MTQQTMTKEQILELRISCTCNDAYKTRQMADPDCGRCNWYDEIISCMDIFSQQEVAKEREEHKKEIERILSSVASGEKLAETLNFDGKTELQKEREKAKNLIIDAKRVLELYAMSKSGRLDGWPSPTEWELATGNLEQSLTEYEKL